jgi:hypothetical protein
MGDLFEAVHKLKQKLPQLAGLAAGPEMGSEKEQAGISIAAQAEVPPPREEKKIQKKTTKTKAKSAPAKRRKV